MIDSYILTILKCHNQFSDINLWYLFGGVNGFLIRVSKNTQNAIYYDEVLSRLERYMSTRLTGLDDFNIMLDNI